MTATIHHHGHGILSFCIVMNAICFPASDIARLDLEILIINSVVVNLIICGFICTTTQRISAGFR